MVYIKRSRVRVRRKRSSKSWYDRKYSTLQLAQKSWQAIKYLKGLVNSERMYSDTTHQIQAQNQVQRIVNVAQGDGPSQRTGNSILLRSIYIRGQIEINSAVSSNTRFTLAIVRDMQQISDTSPSASDIFEDPTDSESMIKRDTAGRFKVIYRKTSFLAPVASGKNVQMIKIYKGMREHLRYNGTGVGDVQKGFYYLVLLTSETTNFPNLQVVSRVSYHDN